MAVGLAGYSGFGSRNSSWRVRGGWGANERGWSRIAPTPETARRGLTCSPKMTVLMLSTGRQSFPHSGCRTLPVCTSKLGCQTLRARMGQPRVRERSGWRVEVSRGRADRVIDVTIGAWKGYVGGMSIMKGKWPPAYGPSVIETVTFTLSTLLWPSGNSIVVDACSLLLREKLSSAISRCTRIDARFVASLERPPSILSQHPRPRATAPKGPLALPHGLLRPLLCPLTILPLP